MSATSRRPRAIEDTEVVVSQVVSAPVLSPRADSLQDLDETLRRRRTIRRPSTVPQDIWEIVQEIQNNGGLYDITVEIARLEHLHERIKEISLMPGEMLPIEHVKMQMKLVKEIATLKSRAVEITMKTKSIITIDSFRVILDSIQLTLKRHLAHDPHLLQKIGDDLGAALRAALSQVRST